MKLVRTHGKEGRVRKGGVWRGEGEGLPMYEDGAVVEEVSAGFSAVNIEERLASFAAGWKGAASGFSEERVGDWVEAVVRVRMRGEGKGAVSGGPAVFRFVKVSVVP
uniref:Uncharacterized protein n=1 Tax=Chromera velia CCMP2878 TaxID=1169474 RepID=A0A0G4HFW6_9ALVE|eukprot:Cvel_27013.t1-p1 / transcript=Cvel_27013.t1 / gene=Cvel_27013 / organism=Chromera_velia_CCMP2878 / gene_product=hypothetical protein / transcript_product=hypothetical protein / location=Cvel_scaffold3304:39-1251(-) / protein_length=106 / sequence_SO=supercontig / SO=protein_coding / is_pseudo=false